MVRIIKRYESRKLYDTEESRYVSLEEIAGFVRGGQEVRVIDNATQADVTPQMLTQIILGEGREGRSPISTEFLHHLLRAGERALSSGVQQVQHGMDRLLEVSMDRIGPVRQAREEMTHLRSRLEDLERSLSQLESEPVGRPAPRRKATKAKAKTKTKAKTRKPAKRKAGVSR